MGVLFEKRSDTHERRVAHLFDRYYACLVRWLSRYTRQSSLAEDFAAQVFAEIMKMDAGTEITQPWGLLTTIARRQVCDHRRRERLEQAYLFEASVEMRDWVCSGNREVEARDTWRMVEAMLATLSPNTQAAFIYSQVDGLTYAEIGKRLGVSVSRVQQYLAKAFAACLTVVEL